MSSALFIIAKSYIPCLTRSSLHPTLTHVLAGHSHPSRARTTGEGHARLLLDDSRRLNTSMRNAQKIQVRRSGRERGGREREEGEREREREREKKWKRERGVRVRK